MSRPRSAALTPRPWRPAPAALGALGALLVVAAPGCADLPRDNPYDAKACSPACAKDRICYAGACIADPCRGTGLRWIPAPGAGRRAFCIAPYEASDGGGGAAAWGSGATPWTGATPGEAQQACRAAGATLCTTTQWYDACVGRDNSGEEGSAPRAADCGRDDGNALKQTGARTRCEGGYTSLFDLVGNAGEWAKVEQTTGSSLAPTSLGYFTLSGPYGGGGNSSSLGCGGGDITNDQYSVKDLAQVGFRCCIPCDSTGKVCQAQPEWFRYELYDSDGNTTGNQFAVGWALWGSGASDLWLADQEFVARFDGSTWTQLPGAGQPGQRPAIWGADAAHVWLTSGGRVHTWDGSQFVVDQGQQSVSGGSFHGLGGTSATDVWAVGEPGVGVWHRDGTGWTAQAAVTNPATLYGVWADRASGQVWAVGAQRQILRYDPGAGTWDSNVPWDSKQAAPTAAVLYAVHGTSATDVWAVGATKDSNGVGQGAGGLVAHYDGEKWRQVLADTSGGGSELYSVRALPGGRVWAAGQRLVSYAQQAGWRWDDAQVRGPVWVPDMERPEEVWVGLFRLR